MDALTFIGLLTGFLAIIIGQMFEGGTLHSLMNFPALLIVLGGTLGAVMVQTPFAIFRRAIRIFPWIFFPPSLSYEMTRNKIVELSRLSRQHGLLSLEDQIELEDNPLLQRGLELLVIGLDKATIQQILVSEMEQKETRDLKAAQVYESMGGYSPTIGILGAVLGLIQVMRNLSDPSALGTGIAVAFVATIYGVGMANLIFLPVATKLKHFVSNHSHFDSMIIEGVLSMASGESPNMLALKLKNYGPKAKEVKNDEKPKA